MAKTLQEIRNQMKRLVEDTNLYEDKGQWVIGFTNPLYSPTEGYVEQIRIWNDQLGDYVRGIKAIMHLLHDNPDDDNIVIGTTSRVEKAYVIPGKDLAEETVTKLNSYCKDYAWTYSSYNFKVEKIN